MQLSPSPERRKQILPARYIRLCGSMMILVCIMVSAGCTSPWLTRDNSPGNTSVPSVSSTAHTSPSASSADQCPQKTAAGNATNASEILFDPVPDHALGDTITFSGTTDLAAGENLSLNIVSTDFTPCAKGTGSSDLVTPCGGGYSGTVTIRPGTCGANTWSWMVDTSEHGFQPGQQYLLIASGSAGRVQNSTLFTILSSEQK